MSAIEILKIYHFEATFGKVIDYFCSFNLILFAIQ